MRAHPRGLWQVAPGKREYGDLMRLRRYLSIITIGALGMVAVPARAQDIGAGTGGGVRLGDAFVLHLGIGAQVLWDSNVFYEATNPTSAFELGVSPWFDLTNRPRGSHRTIEFDLTGQLNYLEYLTSDASVSSHRQFGVTAGMQAAFFTMSPYNFTVYDNYTRTTMPPYTKLPYNFDRDTNEAGLRLSLSPGGGRLTFLLGYRFGVDYFEENDLKPFDLLYHIVDFRASWKFFPKTALYLAATEGIYLYQHPGAYMHPNSYPFRVDLGVQGLITTKLTVNAWIGYGNGFYVSGPSPNTAVGGLALNWKPTLLSTGTLGYEHDFQNSLLGSYYDLDQVFISWTQMIWRFSAFVRASYSNQRFQGINVTMMTPPPSAETNPNRTDNVFMLNLRLDYPFKDWLFASVGYDLQLNRSNGALDLGPMAGVVRVDYTKHVVYIGLSVKY